MRGRHFAFCMGHAPGSHKARSKGPRTPRAIPNAEVRGFALALLEEYGGFRAAERASGVSRWTLYRIVHHRYGVYRRVYVLLERAVRRLDCQESLPSAPLLAYLAEEGYSILGFGDTLARRLQRWQKVGHAPLHSIDDFCTSQLGIHPGVIYGDAIWVGLEAA